MSGKNLDRDRAIKASVPRAIHLSHAARTQWGLDFVRSEFLTRSPVPSAGRIIAPETRVDRVRLTNVPRYRENSQSALHACSGCFEYRGCFGPPLGSHATVI